MPGEYFMRQRSIQEQLQPHSEQLEIWPHEGALQAQAQPARPVHAVGKRCSVRAPGVVTTEARRLCSMASGTSST